MAWGGPEQQAEERANRNAAAKDWHNEALQIVERTVSVTYDVSEWCPNFLVQRWKSIGITAESADTRRANASIIGWHWRRQPVAKVHV
jgi:hypothetical protein